MDSKMIWIYFGAVVSLTGRLVAQVTPLRYQVVEEVRPRVFLGNIAEDAGLTGNLPLEFVFLTDNNYVTLFNLEVTSGLLETMRFIDRDIFCRNKPDCVISLDVVARSHVTNFFEVIVVEVEILDINDNAPVFRPERIDKNVSESHSPGLLFPLVPAEDPDSPANSSLSYRLDAGSNSGLFSLTVNKTENWVDLKLFLLGELDREEVTSYQLRVLAEDSGRESSKTGTLVIDIHVLDENDARPVFDNELYHVTIPEDHPVNVTIIQLHASDPDSGPNGDVLYSLTPRTLDRYGSIFHIDPHSGEVQLRQNVDHEMQSTYSLTVSAQDQGSGSVPVSTSLIVTVQDVNDNDPEIRFEDPNTGLALDPGHIVIQEHSDAPVAVISVSDPDSGPDGIVTCLLNDTSMFVLESFYEDDYKLTVKRVVDREEKERYDLEIACHDLGEESRRTAVSMSIVVLDLNDHVPRFTQDVYTARIPEDIPWNTYILQVTAIDLDSGPNGKVIYFLDPDAEGNFHIHPEAGVVTSLIDLDREIRDQYDFHVMASDQGQVANVATALVSISVSDVDDELPHFTKRNYEMYIYENEAADSRVGQVQAVDRDLNPHDDFAFSLDIQSSSAADDAFRIDASSGVITTTRPLDREAVDRHHLVVRVLAAGGASHVGSDLATVTVIVQDVNDNKPEVEYPTDGNDSVSVTSDVTVGTLITTIRARDPDQGSNGQLEYFISGGIKDEFVIHPRTGDIYVNAALSQNGNMTFNLAIFVKDDGIPSLNASATLKVTVNAAVGDSNGTLPLSTDDPRDDSLAIILVCTILGTLLLIAVLLVAIFVVSRKAKSESRAWRFWKGARTSLRTISGSLNGHANGGFQPSSDRPNNLRDVITLPAPPAAAQAPGDCRVTELKLTLDGHSINDMQKHSDPDHDSGCDLSHSPSSQGSTSDDSGSSDSPTNPGHTAGHKPGHKPGQHPGHNTGHNEGPSDSTQDSSYNNGASPPGIVGSDTAIPRAQPNWYTDHAEIRPAYHHMGSSSSIGSANTSEVSPPAIPPRRSVPGHNVSSDDDTRHNAPTTPTASRAKLVVTTPDRQTEYATKRVHFAAEDIMCPTDYYYASTEDELESTLDGSSSHGDQRDDLSDQSSHGDVEDTDVVHARNDDNAVNGVPYMDAQRWSFLEDPARFFQSPNRGESPDLFGAGSDVSFPESVTGPPSHNAPRVSGLVGAGVHPQVFHLPCPGIYSPTPGDDASDSLSMASVV